MLLSLVTHFCWTKNSRLRVFPFSTLKMFHCPHSSIISEKKSVVIQIIVVLYVSVFFTFRIFSLSLIFKELFDQKNNSTYDISYPWNIKRNTNELTSETETDSQTWRTGFWLLAGEGSGKGQLGSLEWVCTYCYI